MEYIMADIKKEQQRDELRGSVDVTLKTLY